MATVTVRLVTVRLEEGRRVTVKLVVVAAVRVLKSLYSLISICLVEWNYLPVTLVYNIEYIFYLISLVMLRS